MAVMTVVDLKALIGLRRHFATEHQLSPHDYDALKVQLAGTGLKRNPNLRKEHFLFDGVAIVRGWEP